MSYWIQNSLLIYGKHVNDKIKSYLSKDADNNLNLDFNKILPIPEKLKKSKNRGDSRFCINAYLSSVNPLNEAFLGEKKSAYEYIQTIKKVASALPVNAINDEMSKADYVLINSLRKQGDALSYGREAIENICEFGALDVAQWCMKNWGTTCNAKNTKIDSNKIVFETYMSNVKSLISYLSTVYPEFIFEYAFLDNRSNLEAFYIYNGRIIDIDVMTMETQKDSQKQ